MAEYDWEVCRVGLEDVMSNWRRAGNCLHGVDIDQPPKFIGVSNSATATYMNSTLKYQYVETVNDMLKYKHFKEKHDELFFRQVRVKGLALKTFRSDDDKYFDLEVSSSLAGEVLIKIKVDKETRVSSCKAQIQNALVKANLCSHQTILLFTDTDNNGRKKMLTVVPLKRSGPDDEKTSKKACKQRLN